MKFIFARPARKYLSTAARRPLSCLALVSHRPLSEIARTVPFGVLLNSCEPGNARDVSSMFTAAGRSYRRCHGFHVGKFCAAALFKRGQNY